MDDDAVGVDSEEVLIVVGGDGEEVGGGVLVVFEGLVCFGSDGSDLEWK